MASATIEQLPLDVERLIVMLLLAVVLTALAVALAALTDSGLAAGSRWIRHRRSLLAPAESMFVGRWGREGPELFVVGMGVRPLLFPRAGSANAREIGEVGPVLAGRMLQEILARPPSRELAWALAEERLDYLPGDGFVLQASEVVAWLDARHTVPSRLGGLVAELAGAGSGFVGWAFRPATRSAIDDPGPGAPKAA
jgi:hypothetical protein